MKMMKIEQAAAIENYQHSVAALERVAGYSDTAAKQRVLTYHTQKIAEITAKYPQIDAILPKLGGF
jgi:hypothetical protein